METERERERERDYLPDTNALFLVYFSHQYFLDWILDVQASKIGDQNIVESKGMIFIVCVRHNMWNLTV